MEGLATNMTHCTNCNKLLPTSVGEVVASTCWSCWYWDNLVDYLQRHRKEVYIVNHNYYIHLNKRVSNIGLKLKAFGRWNGELTISFQFMFNGAIPFTHISLLPNNAIELYPYLPDGNEKSVHLLEDELSTLIHEKSLNN